jgi:hypothetical protein
MWQKLSLVFSSILALSLSPNLYASDEIKPLLTVNVPMSHYGIDWQITQTRVLVKNIAYVKNIDIVYIVDGKEERAEAKYFGPADGAYEIWESHSNIPAGAASYRLEYQVGGQTFVDDNNGKLYELVVGPAFYANQNISQALTGQEFYDSYAAFTAVVRNDLGSKKNVKLHYSFDNFQTTQHISMEFQPQYFYGYGLISSPSNNSELYRVSLGEVPTQVESIRYYFSYEVDGQIFYDNNYGRDYSMSRAGSGKSSAALSF